METGAQRGPRVVARRQSSAPLVIMIALVAVALGIGGVLFYLYREDARTEAARQAIMYSDTFHEGITVGGVDVGGLTYAQALEALKTAQEAALGDMHFTLNCNGSNYMSDPSFFTVTSNAEEQLKAAFVLARQGSLTDLQAQLADISTLGRNYDVAYTVEPVQEKFEALIQSISDVTDTAPTPATVAVKQIPLDKDTGSLAAANLGMPEEGVAVGSSGEITTDVRDLRFDFIPGENGWGVEHDELYATIVERTHALDWGTIQVPLGDIQPEVTVETLKETLVLRSSSVTKYSGSSERVFNVKKAVGLIYGTVLQPGEQFSHNGKLGDRTLEGGWMPAPAVIDGGANHEDQPGGGVCQTSTTLYQAVLKGDFKVDNRRGHSTKSSYADGGLDCTIADSTTGNIDFLWTNNTNAPVYVFMWVNTKTKRCYAEIYGEPFNGDFDEIQISSQLVETIEPTQDVYTQNPLLTFPYWQQGNAAKKGYSYDAFKTYLKDGQEVRTVKVDNTIYKMHPARYYVYPGWAGEALDPAYQLAYDKDE